MVVVQCALYAVLLIGSGLFLRSLERVRGLDLGIDVDRIIIATIGRLGPNAEPARVAAMYQDAADRLRRLPTVASVAVGVTVPFSSLRAQSLRVPGMDSVPVPPGGGPYVNFVSPEFFTTLGKDMPQELIAQRDKLAEKFTK